MKRVRGRNQVVARPIDVWPIPSADLTKTMTRLAALALEARNLARYARSSEIEAERAVEREQPLTAAAASRRAVQDRRGAAGMLTDLARECRRLMLWAAYDWVPDARSPYADFFDPDGDDLWVQIIVDEPAPEVVQDAAGV